MPKRKKIGDEVDYKREWHDKKSKSHLTGHCDSVYRKCRHCGDAHPAYVIKCPVHQSK